MSRISELKEAANIIKNETEQGRNTAGRVGNLYTGIIDFLEVLDGKSTDYDDTEIRDAINRIDDAIRQIDTTIENAVNVVNQERERLDGVVQNIDTTVRNKVDSMFGTAEWIKQHADIFREGLEGEIQYQSGWDENIEAYLQSVGVWARDNDVTKTNYSTITQSVDQIQSTVAEVQQDLNDKVTSTQWSQITQKTDSIESNVNKLVNEGQITDALQSSINQSIDGKVASLNLETTYAKVDTENSKEILEWMYSALRNESSPEKTFNQLVSAGKSGLNSGISEVRTYVEAVKHGDAINYVAQSSLESKVNDAITGLYNKAQQGQATSMLFSQVKKDSEDIATIVTAATGDATTASIATKFQNWKAGLVTDTKLGEATAALATKDELSGATAGLALKSYVDQATANLATTINNKTAGVITKSTLDGAMAEVFAGDATMDVKASIVTAINNNTSSVQISANKIDLSGVQSTIQTNVINNIKSDSSFKSDIVSDVVDDPSLQDYIDGTATEFYEIEPIKEQVYVDVNDNLKVDLSYTVYVVKGSSRTKRTINSSQYDNANPVLFFYDDAGGSNTQLGYAAYYNNYVSSYTNSTYKTGYSSLTTKPTYLTLVLKYQRTIIAQRVVPVGTETKSSIEMSDKITLNVKTNLSSAGMTINNDSISMNASKVTISKSEDSTPAFTLQPNAYGSTSLGGGQLIIKSTQGSYLNKEADLSQYGLLVDNGNYGVSTRAWTQFNGRGMATTLGSNSFSISAGVVGTQAGKMVVLGSLGSWVWSDTDVTSSTGNWSNSRPTTPWSNVLQGEMFVDESGYVRVKF